MVETVTERELLMSEQTRAIDLHELIVIVDHRWDKGGNCGREFSVSSGWINVSEMTCRVEET